MIGVLKGTVAGKTDGVIISVSGIGFEVQTTEASKMSLPGVGEECLLYTHVKYNRDEIPQIYGFLKKEEKDIFKLMISVSGIGPRVSLAVLETYTPSQIVSIITEGGTKDLCMVSGLGEKGAKRIIVDLKDKIKKIDVEKSAACPKGVYSDAVSALNSLGWQTPVSRRVVEEVLSENPDIKNAEEIIKLSLPKLGGRK